MDPLFHLQERKNMGMQGNDVLKGNNKVMVNLALSPDFSCSFTLVRPKPI